MERTTWKNAIYCMATAIITLIVASLFVLFPPSVFKASAEETDTRLLSPNTYEEYLSLQSPTDVAVSTRFMAIADKNLVYIFDKTQNTYNAYTHEYYPGNPSSNNVSKLQFDASGNLYFLDGHELFVLPFDSLSAPQTATATATNFACSSFLVVDNTLYFTDAKSGNTQLLETDIQAFIPNKQNRKTIIAEGLTGIPTLAYWQDELYFAAKGLTTTLYKFNPTLQTQRPLTSFSDKEIARFDLDITSLAVQNNTLGFCTNVGDFYSYALPKADAEHQLKKQSGRFLSLCSFGDYFYAVDGTSVRQYDLISNLFTSFEICDNSSSFNRLSGATDLVQTGDTLFIADTGNSRIQMFDVVQNAFVGAINVDMVPSFMASTESSLLVANAQKVVIHSLQEKNFGEIVATFDGFQDDVVGAVALYGKYYFATANHAYLIQKDQTDTFLLTSYEKASFRPELLCADVYGNLYTLRNGEILQFSEGQFIDGNETGERIATVSFPVEKLMMDYERQPYVLSGNTVYALKDNRTYTLPSIVYGNAQTLTSFAFDVEENHVYMLVNGNALAVTTDLHLPTVNTIPVDDADTQIFVNDDTDVQVVSVKPNALLVAFDLSRLQDATYFPYLSHQKTNEAHVALALGQIDGYHVIAIFNGNENKYFTYLTKTEFCENLDVNEYMVSYDEEKSAWTTNDVNLYKFPYLSNLLTRSSLERGVKISLLGEINGLDNDYYYVSYTQTSGEVVYGYIPKTYALLFDASTVQPNKSTIGVAESDKDATPRFVVLILGFAVICILTDFLLLRKKTEEDE